MDKSVKQEDLACICGDGYTKQQHHQVDSQTDSWKDCTKDEVGYHQNEDTKNGEQHLGMIKQLKECHLKLTEEQSCKGTQQMPDDKGHGTPQDDTFMRKYCQASDSPSEGRGTVKERCQEKGASTKDRDSVKCHSIINEAVSGEHSDDSSDEDDYKCMYPYSDDDEKFTERETEEETTAKEFVSILHTRSKTFIVKYLKK